MSEQRIFWDYEEHLGTILAKGDDPLGKLSATVDFERFRPILEKAAGRPRGAKGGASGAGRRFEIQDAGSAGASAVCRWMRRSIWCATVRAGFTFAASSRTTRFRTRTRFGISARR